MMGGGCFGKVLILSFRDDEEYIINRILSCMSRETEILYQGEVQNGQFHFEGLYIDEQKRIAVREDKEIELTYTEFEILLLLAGYSVKSRYTIVSGKNHTLVITILL